MLCKFTLQVSQRPRGSSRAHLESTRVLYCTVYTVHLYSIVRGRMLCSSRVGIVRFAESDHLIQSIDRIGDRTYILRMDNTHLSNGHESDLHVLERPNVNILDATTSQQTCSRVQQYCRLQSRPPLHCTTYSESVHCTRMFTSVLRTMKLRMKRTMKYFVQWSTLSGAYLRMYRATTSLSLYNVHLYTLHCTVSLRQYFVQWTYLREHRATIELKSGGGLISALHSLIFRSKSAHIK